MHQTRILLPGALSDEHYDLASMTKRSWALKAAYTEPPRERRELVRFLEIAYEKEKGSTTIDTWNVVGNPKEPERIRSDKELYGWTRTMHRIAQGVHVVSFDALIDGALKRHTSLSSGIYGSNADRAWHTGEGLIFAQDTSTGIDVVICNDVPALLHRIGERMPDDLFLGEPIPADLRTTTPLPGQDFTMRSTYFGNELTSWLDKTHTYLKEHFGIEASIYDRGPDIRR